MLFKMASVDFPATVFVKTVAAFMIMAMILNGGDNAMMDIGQHTRLMVLRDLSDGTTSRRFELICGQAG